MPYELSWHQDKRIIYERLHGTFDLEEVMAASQSTEKHLNEGTAPVHLVVDMSGLKSFPTNITKLNGMISYLKHPSLGWVIVTGGNTLSSFLVNVLSQVIKFRVAQRPTLELAAEFLRTQDQTLGVPAPVEK
jgi:hypothetical protein